MYQQVLNNFENDLKLKCEQNGSNVYKKYMIQKKKFLEDCLAALNLDGLEEYQRKMIWELWIEQLRRFVKAGKFPNDPLSWLVAPNWDDILYEEDAAGWTPPLPNDNEEEEEDFEDSENEPYNDFNIDE